MLNVIKLRALRRIFVNWQHWLKREASLMTNRWRIKSKQILLEKFPWKQQEKFFIWVFIEAISSKQANYRSGLALKTIGAKQQRDLDSSKLKLSPDFWTSFKAPAHKSSRYLTGSIKMKIQMLLKVFAPPNWRGEAEARFIGS